MLHARERARLAGGLHDEQVFVFIQQRNRALRAEVHIRLVDDDNAVLIVLRRSSRNSSVTPRPVGAFGFGSTIPPFGLS